MIILFIITGCYDPLPTANIINKTNGNLFIEQYEAPNYFYRSVEKNKTTQVVLHCNLLIQKKQKQYEYNFCNRNSKINHKSGAIYRLEVLEDMNLNIEGALIPPIQTRKVEQPLEQ